MSSATTLARFLLWKAACSPTRRARGLACFIDSRQRPDKLSYGTDEPNTRKE